MPFTIKPPLYCVWQSMKDRCLNPRFKQWKDYGGRGIKICERWANSYAAFVEDMGPRPDGYVIDRIDNDGNYEPSNCRWASKKESMRNRRITKWVVIGGQKYKAADLAELSGLKGDTIVKRAESGLSYEEVIGQKRRCRPLETHCKRGHPFDEINTLFIPNGTRICKSCWAWRKKVKTAPYPTPFLF